MPLIELSDVSAAVEINGWICKNPHFMIPSENDGSLRILVPAGPQSPETSIVSLQKNDAIPYQTTPGRKAIVHVGGGVITVIIYKYDGEPRETVHLKTPGDSVTVPAGYVHGVLRKSTKPSSPHKNKADFMVIVEIGTKKSTFEDATEELLKNEHLL